MGTRMIAVEGQLAGNPEVEALYIRDNRTWYSPPGGWMAAQSGKWEQISVAGMAVQGISGTPNVFMAGLVFAAAKKGDSGQLRDQAGGGVAHGKSPWRRGSASGVWFDSPALDLRSRHGRLTTNGNFDTRHAPTRTRSIFDLATGGSPRTETPQRKTLTRADSNATCPERIDGLSSGPVR